jgi:hypothetical protein
VAFGAAQAIELSSLGEVGGRGLEYCEEKPPHGDGIVDAAPAVFNRALARWSGVAIQAALMSSRTMALLILILSSASTGTTEPRTFDLLTANVEDIQAAVDAGALTYERLVEMYLRRIEAYDKNGPKLNAVLTMNPRAVEIARELDRERLKRARRAPRNPNRGQDTVDVKDVACGGNSRARRNVSGARRHRVKKLKDAGAIILFKANSTSSTWSERPQLARRPGREPYDPAQPGARAQARELPSTPPSPP